jgi:hypothetical protein
VDPAIMLYVLIAAMAASGGVLGAFWVRALTIMRRRMVDSGKELRHLAEVVTTLQGQIDDLDQAHRQLHERLKRTEQRLTSGGHPTPPERKVTPT